MKHNLYHSQQHEYFFYINRKNLVCEIRAGYIVTGLSILQYNYPTITAGRSRQRCNEHFTTETLLYLREQHLTQSGTLTRTCGHRPDRKTTNSDSCHPYRTRRGSKLGTYKEDKQDHHIPEEENTRKIKIANVVSAVQYKPTENQKSQMTRYQVVQNDDSKRLSEDLHTEMHVLG